MKHIKISHDGTRTSNEADIVNCKKLFLFGHDESRLKNRDCLIRQKTTFHLNSRNISSHISLGKYGKFVIERGLKVREKTIKH